MRSEIEEKAHEVAKFLYDNGILFALNREILHPLGKALRIGIDDVTGRMWLDGVIETDDPAGFTFHDKVFADDGVKYEEYVEKNADKLEARQRLLGYVIQPRPNGEE